MDQIALPGTGRLTTRLGFGCAYLLPETASLLDAAYDAGIRHFDVARSYGRGLTEGVLGRFLRRRGGEVSVTTKYGIRPPPNNVLAEAARTLLRPVVKRLRRSPAVNRQLTSSIGAMYNKAQFTGPEAEASLQLSLRRLGLERVDMFLMHEASASDLGDPSLLPSLQALAESGVVGAFGVGGEAARIPDLCAARPGFCGVLQYDWTAADMIPAQAGGFSVLYRTFGGAARRAKTHLAENASLRRTWSDEIDQDLSAAGCFERLMMRAAFELRSDALILFSSTRPENIQSNVLACEDNTLSKPAIRLAELVRAHQGVLSDHGV
jgi:D-threo-aldose 1-dehydrogenase